MPVAQQTLYQWYQDDGNLEGSEEAIAYQDKLSHASSVLKRHEQEIQAIHDYIAYILTVLPTPEDTLATRLQQDAGLE